MPRRSPDAMVAAASAVVNAPAVDVRGGCVVQGGGDVLGVQRAGADELAEGQGGGEQGLVAGAGWGVGDAADLVGQRRCDVTGLAPARRPRSGCGSLWCAGALVGGVRAVVSHCGSGSGSSSLTSW